MSSRSNRNLFCRLEKTLSIVYLPDLKVAYRSSLLGFTYVLIIGVTIGFSFYV